jgi:hypothetical protein
VVFFCGHLLAGMWSWNFASIYSVPFSHMSLRRGG